MQYTLLDLTQNVLSGLSSDVVNSISDTPESIQVSQIIKNKYFDIITRVNLPEHDQLIQLEPSVNSAVPVMMYVPENVAEVRWLKYFNTNPEDTASTTSTHDLNLDLVPTSLQRWQTTSVSSNTIANGSYTFTVSTGLPIYIGDNFTATAKTGYFMTGTVISYSLNTLSVNVSYTSGSGTFTSWSISGGSPISNAPGYQYVTILPVEQFIEYVNSFNPNDSDVESFVFTNNVNGIPGTYTFYYKNDNQPSFCTILSNYNVIFDSYDSTQDSTLQSSKIMGWGRVIPTFEMVDTFVPNLDDEQFQLLLNESKALAYFELKQMVHPLAQQEVKRGWSTVQKNKSKSNKPSYFNALPDFGRSARPFNQPESYFKYRGFDHY